VGDEVDHSHTKSCGEVGWNEKQSWDEVGGGGGGKVTPSLSSEISRDGTSQRHPIRQKKKELRVRCV